MNETFADEYPDQPMMSLHRLAKLQGMDEDKLRPRMEAYDKPSPKGGGMRLAYNGLWPSDQVEVFVRFGKIVIARLNDIRDAEGCRGDQFIVTGDGHTNYWPCLRAALRHARIRISASQRKHLDAWVDAPPSWARDEMGQKWPLNSTPIEGFAYSNGALEVPQG